MSEAEKKKEKRLAAKEDKMRQAKDENDKYEASWLQIPSDLLSCQCCNRYRRATNVTVPDPCASCAQARFDIQLELRDVYADQACPQYLEVLRLPEHYEFAADFEYLAFPVLSRLILYKPAVMVVSCAHAQVALCNKCDDALKKMAWPRFALANTLYHRELPEKFQDLTWVEEMVCSVYRTTAHVTRLYQLLNPANPLVFHGNTCTHNMNVVSMAAVLSHTPSDIVGQLSVVFVGPRSLKSYALKSVFRIRKEKLWRFLLWLRGHNALYCNLPLSLENLKRYKDNDIPDGLDEATIVDEDLDPKLIFEEETAGIKQHPAQAVRNDEAGDDSTIPKAFIEAMGVSDPEGDKIPGRPFRASALQNVLLHDTETEAPNLIIS